MHIALVYNEPMPSRYDALGEGVAIASVLDAVWAINDVLVQKGYTVSLLGLQPPLRRATTAIKHLQADLVFNLFEGFESNPETEWVVAEALNKLRIPFTGAPAQTLALCLNKARAKEHLALSGIPTPPYRVISAADVRQFPLAFPVIVKPLKEDGSHGITSVSVVWDVQALKKQVQLIGREYGSPVLVEGFLRGREFNVSILGGQPPRVLPLSELVYSPAMPGPRILTYAAKWLPHHPEYKAAMPVCPAPVSEAQGSEIAGLAVAAYEAVGSPPYARVDLRYDEDGSLHILEVNPNPDLSPDAGMALQARAAGLGFDGLIDTILRLALEESRVGSYPATAIAG